MTTTIDNLAMEAADPLVAGEKMRQLYLTHCKLTNRQLTVDLLMKLMEFKVGTHEVEKIALSLIKGEVRRNPENVSHPPFQEVLVPCGPGSCRELGHVLSFCFNPAH